MQPANITLAERLSLLNSAIKKAAPGSSPTLIAVSKGQPAEAIEALIAAGVTHFGENKVQEAWAKWPAIKAAHPHIKLHMIGSLQSNKAREAVALFDVIHSVDRPSLADALMKEMRAQGGMLDCLIQVNTGEEPQKSGVAPHDFTALLGHCRTAGLSITGLMCVPPAGVNPAPHFALLYKIARANGLRELSMGMSSDYETATRLGATMVRIGTALFGARGNLTQESLPAGGESKAPL